MIICGHRGSPSGYCENTLESFTNAIMAGANAIELDLCITKDKVVVVWHDWDSDNMVANVREMGLEPDTKYMPYNITGKAIPKLTHEQFIKSCGYRLKMNTNVSYDGNIVPNIGSLFSFIGRYRERLDYIFLDVKTPENDNYNFRNIMAEITKNIVDFGLYDVRFIIETFHEDLIREYVNPEFSLSGSLLSSVISFAHDGDMPIGYIFWPKKYSPYVPVINLNVSYVVPLRPTALTFGGWFAYKKVIRYDRRLMKRFHKNVGIIAATINDIDEMRKLIKMGVAGIQTNHPYKLSKIVKELKK